MALDLLAQAEHGADSPAVLGQRRPRGDRGRGRRAGRLARGASDPSPLSSVPACPWRSSWPRRSRPSTWRSPPATPRRSHRSITRSGAVFVGPNCATAFGDYVAGSNHVLPTGGAARYASALGPTTFLRRMSVVDMTDEAVEALTPAPGRAGRRRGLPDAPPLGRGRGGGVVSRTGEARRSDRARPTCACAWSWTGPGRRTIIDRRGVLRPHADAARPPLADRHRDRGARRPRDRQPPHRGGRGHHARPGARAPRWATGRASSATARP